MPNINTLGQKMKEMFVLPAALVSNTFKATNVSNINKLHQIILEEFTKQAIHIRQPMCRISINSMKYYKRNSHNKPTILGKQCAKYQYTPSNNIRGIHITSHTDIFLSIFDLDFLFQGHTADPKTFVAI